MSPVHPEDAMPSEEQLLNLDSRVSRPRDGVTVLVLRGELDLDTAPALERTAHQALAESSEQVGPSAPVQAAASAESLILDCAGVTFCDSSGLNTLLRLHQHLAGLGIDLSLASVPEPLHRLLDITGADLVIPQHADLGTALAS